MPTQAAASAAAANAVPALPAGAAFSWSGYFEAVGILFLLLGLLWGAAWFIRRSGRWNFIPRPGTLPRDALFLETQLPLGAKKGLAVVRFLNSRLLLGITEQQITVLKETDIHDPQLDPHAARRFAQALDEAGSEPDAAPSEGALRA